ncbi:hypothetical protein F7734_24785 [Scytonema sp. UIC 10036]|uniref:hypothetical protein n=1 Tax=Scytonema sp. UIC 10036 TaxID=2304196 RepID=UPI0012DA9CB8|nr:hypothetical protein [Scytonema sp. UIC 10036]MUG95404.1 hypothetical protein [Scytonema sp. UIC 10036]
MVQDVSYATFRNAIAQMNNLEFWKAPDTERFIWSRLPDYRLSKFHVSLPFVYSLEMTGNYLLDISRTVQFLNLI